MHGTKRRITLALPVRERRSPHVARDPMTGLAVGTEDGIVSHDGLLAASPHPEGTSTENRWPAMPDQVASDPAAGYRAPAGADDAICAFAPGLESVRAGREFTRSTLRRWGITGVSDRAELVVSELVTNALRHGLPSARWMPGEHPIRLRLLRHAHYLICMVADPGTEMPVRQDSGQCAESGRGLLVVESCCLRWGCQLVDGRGKVVWALLQSRE